MQLDGALMERKWKAKDMNYEVRTPIELVYFLIWKSSAWMDALLDTLFRHD
jgi:hypothetical protein